MILSYQIRRTSLQRKFCIFKKMLYEPKVALEGGEDGLKFYREIVKQGKNHLKEDGFFAFEIGAAQGMAVQEICKEEGFGNIVLYQDLDRS